VNTDEKSSVPRGAARLKNRKLLGPDFRSELPGMFALTQVKVVEKVDRYSGFRATAGKWDCQSVKYR
jgi:hypothetical protein